MLVQGKWPGLWVGWCLSHHASVSCGILALPLRASVSPSAKMRLVTWPPGATVSFPADVGGPLLLVHVGIWKRTCATSGRLVRGFLEMPREGLGTALLPEPGAQSGGTEVALGTDTGNCPM